jgi:pimeloyl-ACP methyl ester carboxylesterase
MSAAARHPEKFHAYVGMAQIANWAQSDELAYRWALDQAQETGNRKALEQLTEIGPPPWREFERWSTLRLWLVWFGGFYRSEDASAQESIFSRWVPILSPGLPALLSPLLTSPDYTLADLLRLFSGLRISTEALLNDIARLDLFDSAPRVEVPVYFFHGMHDQGAQLPIAQRYVEALDAPRGKQLTLLDGSAHIFSAEDSRKVERFLRETLPSLTNTNRQAPLKGVHDGPRHLYQPL